MHSLALSVKHHVWSDTKKGERQTPVVYKVHLFLHSLATEYERTQRSEHKMWRMIIAGMWISRTALPCLRVDLGFNTLK